MATPAELKKTRLPKGAVGFAVCVPYDGVTKRRQRGEVEVVVFEPGDPLADARGALVAAGFESDAVASLSPELAPTTKARAQSGPWNHGGNVLPLLAHK